MTSQTASSPSRSLAVYGGIVTVTSPLVDLAGASALRVSAWIRRGSDSFSEDPDSGGDFYVEYLRSDGNPVAPFYGEIALSIDVIDEDGVAFLGNPVTIGGTSSGAGIAFDATKRFQFGRVSLDNAHGSELVDLSMALRAQRFDGTTFVDDTNDSCSRIPASALSLTQSPSGLGSSAAFAHDPLASGDAGLSLAAPSSTGTIDILVDLGASGADLPWLRYDWPEDGNLDGILDDDPLGRATFGIWEGRDSLIFLRERY